jgi:hypothetical protein
VETKERESGFVIDGASYAVPTLDTITLDEERVLFTYADVVVQDFLPPHPDWKEHVVLAYRARQEAKFRDPAFKRALAHIAYRRAHREVSDAEIQEALGTLNALEVDLAVLKAGEEEADPPKPTSPNEHETTNEQSEHENSGDSGTRTETSSETPEETLDSSGTSESDTSSPLSPASASAD